VPKLQHEAGLIDAKENPGLVDDAIAFIEIHFDPTAIPNPTARYHRRDRTV
jgi:hypothetical protein